MHRVIRFFKIKFLLHFFLIFCFVQETKASPISLFSDTLFHKGYWIKDPKAKGNGYGVFHFRKKIKISQKPQRFRIHVSGDQRYILYVNGIKAGSGPSRSDPSHWKYNTLDIAQYLIPGQNILAAVVWNDGEFSALAQMSLQTGFLIFGDSEKESMACTDSTWKVIENLSYSPQTFQGLLVSPDEQILGSRYPWNWENLNYDDSSWLNAGFSENILFSKAKDRIPSRILYESSLPQPEEKVENPLVIRNISGIKIKAPGFLNGKNPLHIPAHTIVYMLLDQTYLTTANIKLFVSGGKGSKLSLTYAESLVDEKGRKGNRNAWQNKRIQGNADVFYLDGGKNRAYKPLFYRTYRYILLHIENLDEGLDIQDLHGDFTAYPFTQTGKFYTDDTILNHIWKTGWRTSRLCAYETFMDCPFYEQLQYVGDTRIQSLISLYVSGDDRLMRNAIDDIQNSMIAEGLTQSRYPSHVKQIIPPFSLFWISMIHDYWMYRKDDAYIKSKLPFIIKILNWHQHYVGTNGLLQNLPYWNFVDWPVEWPWLGTEIGSGTPKLQKNGNSSILTLQFVLAIEKTSDLFHYFGLESNASNLRFTANQLKNEVFKTCWDPAKKYLADLPDKSEFSQHAQAMGILTHCIPDSLQKELILRTLPDTSLVQCTYYYRFYLFEALRQCGLENLYQNYLNPWKEMLKMGLTSFAEQPEPSRSDCHAWSASPTFDLLYNVAGIRPSSSGFGTVLIQPELGNLHQCEAAVSHPNGPISVKFIYGKGHWNVLVQLPKGLPGSLSWAGKMYLLKPDKNSFIFKK